MSIYDVKKIQVYSIFKVLPVVFAVPLAVVGLFAFLFFPNDLIARFSFGARMLSLVVFVAVCTVVMTTWIVIMAWLYNFVTSKLSNGIVISLESKE